MPDRTPALIIFAKAPVPGRCKTRLAARMGTVLAARCYAAMTERVIAEATRLAPGAVVLACAPSTRHPFFKRLARVYGCRLRPQAYGTLGQRMHRALAEAIRQHDSAIILGTDQPDLTGGPLVDTLAALQDGSGMGFAPTVDGGYWLIGGTTPAAGVFQGISWSTARVAAQTRAALRASGLSWFEGPSMRDIDDYRDWCAQPRRQRSHLLQAAVMPGRRYGLSAA